MKSLTVFSVSLLLCLGLMSQTPHAPIASADVVTATPPTPLNLPQVSARVEYPLAAAEAGISGVVLVRILVDEEGRYIKHAVVQQVHPLLVQAVEPHLKNLTFKPAKHGITPIKAWITLPFSFRFGHSDASQSSDPAQLLQMGREAYCQGDYGRAHECFSQGLALAGFPANPDALQYSLQQGDAGALFLLQNAAASRQGFARLIGAAAASGSPHAEMLPALYVQRALASLQQGATLDALNDLNWVSLHHGDYLPGPVCQQALASFAFEVSHSLAKPALHMAQLQPGQPLAWYILGRVLQETQQPDAAREAFFKAASASESERFREAVLRETESLYFSALSPARR